MNIVCPIYGDDDQICKISGIVSSGTSKEIGTYTTSSSSGRVHGERVSTIGVGRISSTHVTDLVKKAISQN